MVKKRNNILIACLMNLCFVVLEIIGGIFTGSMAILSDSIHDLGDTISLFIAYILDKISYKKPNKKYTYGYQRYSLLGSIITALVLLGGSVIVIISSINRIQNPIDINYDGMIIVAIIGFIINAIGFKLTHDTNHMNEKMISLHLLEDTLSWILVIIISIVIRFTSVTIIDPILSIIIAVYITVQVIKNLIKVFSVILDKAPSEIDVDKLKIDLKEELDIIDLHHIHLWTIDGESNYLTMHVIVKNNITNKEIIEIKHSIKEELIKHKIHHATIEIEFEEEECTQKICKINESEKNNYHGHKHNH